ncbi:MAG: endopeptidase La [Fimbriimonadaceae bacterium]|nr:endopeptidase La [Fimbriimonadaceae bacterium]
MSEPPVTPAEAQPRDVYLLALPELLLFPGQFLPVVVDQPDLIRTVDAAFAETERLVAVVPRAVDPAALEAVGGDVSKLAPGPLREVGTLATIPRMRRASDGSMQLLLHGQHRLRLLDAAEGAVPVRATILPAPDQPHSNDTVEALSRSLQQTFARMAELIPQTNEELVQTVQNTDSPLEMVYLLAVTVRMEAAERYAVLAADDLEQKLRTMLKVLRRELDLLELGSKLQSEAAGEISRSQREYFLRQQLKAIRQELGESGDDGAELDELRDRLEAAALPEEALTTARRELRRLEQIPQQAAEYHVIRTYLDLILELPWNSQTADDLDLRRAQRVLDEDHWGLAKVKDRILEYLAVRKLKQDLRGPVLCFVGPPGVGKTSLGQSIARSLGRQFVRLSLGGVHDEAEIRGHRRTYIGAMPGRVIESLRRCGVRNPVFMLDEIDKVTASLHGDPSSALLEVLDPAQNNTFRDNYLDLPFDLSQVLFITTANVLQTVQPALRDRLELLEIEGYTDLEKQQIARRYLLPRQVRDHGLQGGQFELTVPALRRVIGAYTRESGVRNLERQIGSLCRKAARQVAGGKERVVVRQGDLAGLLGPETVYNEVAARTARPGVVTGLSVTATGGDVLFIEALRMPGTGQLKLTGQLGDVMRESAEAAFSFVRANATALGVAPEVMATSDFHLHVPAGGIPKDGPSAGITMATALLSALLERPVDPTVAMTGEVTLTGQVLPIGGVKEKVLAARRAGIKTVLLPARNAPEAAQLPAEVRSSVELVTVDQLPVVFQRALGVVVSGPARG